MNQNLEQEHQPHLNKSWWAKHWNALLSFLTKWDKDKNAHAILFNRVDFIDL